MKQFLKFTFASCLGTMIGLVGLFFIFIWVISAMGSAFSNKDAVIPKSAVLHLTFEDPIPELKNNLEQGNSFEFETDDKLGLQDVLAAIETAKTDENIKGIFIDPKGSVGGLATSLVVHEAISDFKESGKFIIAYSDYYSQGGYYMAALADKVVLNPIGNVDFRGFASVGPYFKDLLDKVGVEYQVFYAGQFKSATEPYRRNEMSEQSRLQTKEYMRDLWDIYLDGISQARGKSKTELNLITSNFSTRNAEGALESEMVDEIGYRSRALALIRESLEYEENKKINFVSISDYASAKKRSKGSGSNKIAVVYAEGTLLDTGSGAGTIDGGKYETLLRKLREDNKIKALVLRVNSPGGSVLASSKILEELKMIQDQGIPVIASYGDLAASGGYYISCHADSIFAEPSTITGSIGVFAMIPNAKKLLDEKLGIHFDSVKTHKFAGSFNVMMDWSREEKKIFQDQTDNMYKIFLSIVAEGRDMSVEEVHKIAQGRVWSGQRAVDNGLVDKLGGLDDAIAAASKMADISEYRIREYPAVSDPITQLMEKFTKKSNIKSAIVKESLGDYAQIYEYLELIKAFDEPMALMPFRHSIN